MGAGSITSNVKSDKTLVVVKSAYGNIETGLKKMGAMIGDNVEVGCNSVLNPGTVIGRNTNIYPTSMVRDSSNQTVFIKTRRNCSQNEIKETDKYRIKINSRIDI